MVQVLVLSGRSGDSDYWKRDFHNLYMALQKYVSWEESNLTDKEF